MTPLLNYREDRRSIVFVGVTLLLLLAPFVVEPAGIWVLPWLMATSLFCFSSCVINHNHVHTSLFRQARLNDIFGLLLTLARGHTSAGVILAHNHNHHVHTGGSGDWIGPHLAGAGHGSMRMLRFLVAAVRSMARGRRLADASMLSVQVRRRQRIELAWLWAATPALALWDAGIFLVFVVLPWALGVVLLVGVNLLQHDGCRADSRLDHSRNFTGRLGNWFFFNNGYHTAHHMHPAMHWSRLPHWHAEQVAPSIDRGLEQRSILRYLYLNHLAATTPSQGEYQ